MLAQPVRQNKQTVYHFSHTVAAMLPLAQLVRQRASAASRVAACMRSFRCFSLSALPQSVEVAQANPGVFSVEDEARLPAPCAYRVG